MAKMNGKDGHWYTDQNGNHYFVGEGESPKEGWEKTKRRKMIDGGKYKVDDGDGKGSREVSMEEYDRYEAEDGDFDMTTDDDFGFDTDDRPTPEQDLENEEIWDADYERSYGPYNFDAWDDVEMLKKAYGKAKEAGMEDSAQNALERIEELGGEFDPDESDGTNGWKPSDEATPAYDAGGFYSINEGDKWELDDGGSVEVRNVDGENVEVVTPNGTKRMTKDQLSDMVKNATKTTADANKGNQGSDDSWSAENPKYKGDFSKQQQDFFNGKGNPPGWTDPDDLPGGKNNPIESNDEAPKPKKTVGEDLQEMYERAFFEQANGNKEDFVNHFINRFGVPRGSSRRREAEFYGKRFDKLNASQNDSWNAENPKYKDFNPSDATNVKVLEEGDEYEDPNTGKKSKLKIIEYTPYGLLRFGRKDRMYSIVGDDYEGGDTHRKGAIVAPSLESAKEQLKEFTDYYKAQKKEKKR